VLVLFLFFIRIPIPKAQVALKSTFWSALKSLDLIGFVLFAPAAIMFLLALEWGGNAYKWDSATVIGLFCGAAAILPIFLFWEYKKGISAMLPFPMLKHRPVYSGCIAMFFTASNLLITSYYMAIYFQAVRGDSPLVSGVHVLPSVLSQMLLGVTSGVLGQLPE
jgi:hypothetical protein